MSGYCGICRTKTNKKIFKLPKNETKRKQWTQSLGVVLSDSSRICEKHFKDSDFHYPSESDNGNKRVRLNAKAIPEKFVGIFTEHVNSSSASNATDFSSQTEKEVIESGIMLENLRLKLQVTELQRENKRLTQEVHQMHTMMKSLDKLFTTSQLRQLRNDGKRVCWNPEDIAYAVCLHTVGPRAYRHLCKKGFPFPHERTLRNYSQTVKIQPGTMDFVLNLLSNSVDIDDKDKLCVLSFDKMKVASDRESTPTERSVPPPENYVQVAMVQGLKKSWKQPIYFDYNTSMTAEMINVLIRKIYTAGYTVVALVCDVGPKNCKLWSELKISPEKSWFPHPVQSDMNVFVFADVPHLIKDLRYHFLDCGLMWGEKVIGAKAIEETLDHFSHSDLSLTWKVAREHLIVSGPERNNIELATQLLSNSTAVVITRCLELGLHVGNGEETAEFVTMVESWFDLFNSKLPTSSWMLCSVLQQMSAWMATPIKPGSKEERWPFQEGILISNSSLDFLRCYVAEKYDMEYVITSRLSLDHLEHFFCTMRSQPTHSPTPQEFESRIRKYILDNVIDLCT